jgi:heptosyltransferase-2
VTARGREPTIERILIKQVNWLGDLVMTLPATRAVRDAFPAAALTVMVKRELAGFYDGADWIDEVLPYRVGSGWAAVVDQRDLVRELRRRRFDAAVIFPRSFSSALWMALARIPRRVGYVDDARGFLLTERHVRTPDLLQRHQVHEHLELVTRALGAPVHSAQPVVPVSIANERTMSEWLATARRGRGALVALAVAAAFGPAKEWPAASYSALIDLLAERHGIECVLVGSPGERDRCLAVAAAARCGALVAAGDTSVGELLALLSLCDGFAGNDSGAMHVAAALGIPTVGIFGSTRPLRTGPLGPWTRIVQHSIECSPCMQRQCRFGHYDCLRSITADQVAAGLTRTIHERSAASANSTPSRAVLALRSST